MSRVLYVSYDGATEPLGRSQVVPYLLLLARDHEIALVSFEKDEADRAALAQELSAHGIEWIPLRYHRRPPVLSTAYDVFAGRRALRRVSKHGAPDIVHVRSYVPALIALLAQRKTGGRLLFDIRGFWADERVEGGLWRAGGVVYRIAKRWERRFFAEAEAIVTLTEASLPQIRAWTRGRPVHIEVIPTCVDTERFGHSPARPDGPRALWSGSVGTWYRFDLAVAISRAAGLPLTVLTRQEALARELLAGHPAEVHAVAPPDMPDALHAGDIGMCLIAATPSKVASAPTRFAEYLAAGMPVAITPGVGDLEELAERGGVGVVIREESPEALREAANRLTAMAADDEVRARCRSLAAEVFDLRLGAARYAAVYDLMLTG